MACCAAHEDGRLLKGRRKLSGGRRARFEARVAAGGVAVDVEKGVWWFDLKFPEGGF